ncbi:MAG: hypothetical protein AAFR31_06605 [Cyanobacteria bacterium J06627_8]
MPGIIATLPIIEVAFFCLGVYVWLRTREHPYSVSAALSLGIISGMGILSLLLQVGFLIQLPEVIPMLELGAIAVILRATWGSWHHLDEIRQRTVSLWKTYPLIVSIVAIAFIYLFFQAVLLPPSSWDATIYHLPRVLLWEQNRSLFLRDFTIPQQAVFPVGSDILFHLFLRLQTDYGLGLFSWLSSIAILLSTFALARSHFSQAISLTTALAIACLPEVVYQATATKNDIILAAVSLACVLWAYRWLSIQSFESLAGFGLTLCFGVAVKTSFVLFALFFVPLWLSMVIYQNHLLTLLRMLIRQWRISLPLMIPAFVLSQAWLFWDNYQQFGEWVAPAEFAFINQNNDGLWGGIANVIRYGFQSIHLLNPVDEVWNSALGWRLTSALQSAYETLFDPILGKAGFAEIAKGDSFNIVWQPREYASWFGPVSVFLIYPAVVWALLRGKRLTRTMAAMFVLLVLIISYKIGWSPWKSRFFTLVFTSAGFCVAAFLDRLKPRQWQLKTVCWISVIILGYASLFNYTKPTIPTASFYLAGQNIWIQSNWTRNRLIYDHLSRGQQVEHISQALESAERVAIVGYDHYFSLMFYNPHLNFTLLTTQVNPEDEHSLIEINDKLKDVDHLVCLQRRCSEPDSTIELELLWDNFGTHGHIPQVYRVSS